MSLKRSCGKNTSLVDFLNVTLPPFLPQSLTVSWDISHHLTPSLSLGLACWAHPDFCGHKNMNNAFIKFYDFTSHCKALLFSGYGILRQVHCPSWFCSHLIIPFYYLNLVMVQMSNPQKDAAYFSIAPKNLLCYQKQGHKTIPEYDVCENCILTPTYL